MARLGIDKKIGVYGGTFNPVHIGHLNAAKTALEELDLDEVLFIPVNLPPHKKSLNLVSSKDRLEMLRLALIKDSRFKISKIEIDRQGLSYTIDTLKELEKIYGVKLYFIMGSDSYISFESWYKWREILQTASLVVIKRPGYEIKKEKLLKDGYLEEEKNRFSHGIYKNIFFMDIKGIDISSTRIREVVDNSQKLMEYTGKRVSKYIERKGLYR